jgi:hypothetical protein
LMAAAILTVPGASGAADAPVADARNVSHIAVSEPCARWDDSAGNRALRDVPRPRRED